MKNANSLLSLNTQHDYITLKTPNGNFTVSWSGSKASGKLALNKKAFHALDNYVQTEGKKSSYGDAMKNLLNPEVLTSLWSDWNAPVKKNDFVPGDVVKFDQSSLFAKKYPNGGWGGSRYEDINPLIAFEYLKLKGYEIKHNIPDEIKTEFIRLEILNKLNKIEEASE